MKTDTDKTRQVLELEKLTFDMQRPDGSVKHEEMVDAAEEELELQQVVEGNEILVGVITEQAKYKRLWQIVAACLIILLAGISYISSGLYTDRENQIEKLGQAQVNIQKVNKHSVQVDQKVKTLEEQLVNSRAEIEEAQSLFINSSSETQELQKKLANTSGRLKTLQKRNAAVVERLNERLQNLSGNN